LTTGFLERALVEARRYGEDDWVFLRELSQNARDARASRIEVHTGRDDTREWVIFDDDGSGMSFEHARSFFFRLYASSKEQDPEAAGRFGVGFWSVLRFGPRRILVESRTRDEAWAVELGGGLSSVERRPCSLTRPGTRIALERPRTAAQEEPAVAVRAALRRYCRLLRRVGGGFEPLPIRVDGVAVNEPLGVPGPVSVTFRSREAEGAVGLGELPRVELHARGLLVREVAVLDELEPDWTGRVVAREVAGLSPVVVLDSQRLDVVLSRRAVVPGRPLRRLTRLARARVRRVIMGVLAGALRPSLTTRLLDLRDALGRGRRMLFLTFATLGVAGVAFAVTVYLSQLPPHGGATTPLPGRVEPPVLTGPPVPVPAPYAGLLAYDGARVDAPAATVPALEGRVDAAGQLELRALTLDRYDVRRGWLPTAVGELGAHPAYRCREGCVRVALRVRLSPGPMVVPAPTGFRVEPDGLLLDGVPIGPVARGGDDAFVIATAPAEGVLVYRVGPSPRVERPGLDDPPVRLPADLAAAVTASRRERPDRRVSRLVALARDHLRYDVSAAVARAYAERRGPWLDDVLAIGAGDCDVKNGLAALLVRRAGVPARVAVGYVMEGGRALPGLHAWTEAWLQGRWQPFDATGPQASPVVSRAEGPSTAPRTRPGAALDAVAPRPVGAAAPPTSAEADDRRAASLAAPALITAPATSGDEALPLVWAAVATAMLLVVVTAVVHARRRVRERLVSSAGAAEARSALARMLRDALVHPEAWSQQPELWHRRVLPTLRGPPLSLARALDLGREGRLHASFAHSPLAEAAARAGAPVLDGADSCFGAVVSALGEAQDLDAVDALRPYRGDLRDGQVPVELAALVASLDEVNQLLARAGLDVRCHPCPALAGGPLRDVDLTPLRLPRGGPWLPRWVALSPRHPEVRRRVAAARGVHGRFAFIEWLTATSSLLARDGNRLRELAAWAFVEAAS
jgi:transglutaminase-like putative cysteine protease